MFPLMLTTPVSSHIDSCCLCAMLFLEYCIQIIYKSDLAYLLSITKLFAIPCTPTPCKTAVSVTKAISMSKHSNIIIMCTFTCALLLPSNVMDTILNVHF
jgi:hypothetical protein